MNLDVQDWKIQPFAEEVLQKSAFEEVGIFMIPVSIFHDLGWPWDQFHVELGIFVLQTCYLACLVASLRRPV